MAFFSGKQLNQDLALIGSKLLGQNYDGFLPVGMHLTAKCLQAVCLFPKEVLIEWIRGQYVLDFFAKFFDL